MDGSQLIPDSISGTWAPVDYPVAFHIKCSDARTRANGIFDCRTIPSINSSSTLLSKMSYCCHSYFCQYSQLFGTFGCDQYPTTDAMVHHLIAIEQIMPLKQLPFSKCGIHNLSSAHISSYGMACSNQNGLIRFDRCSEELSGRPAHACCSRR